MKYVHKFSPYFFKQLTRLVCFISVVYIGPGSMTSVQANDRDSLRKAQIAASVKLLNRAITHNTLKKPTAASRYLIDRLNYVSSDTKAQIEQVLAQLQQTTGKELYAIITRNPDMIDEETAETKFKQETQDFSNQVHQASMLGDNSTLLTISFVKSAVGKKRWVNISYFQGTGITVGSQLVSHEITTPAFQSQLQNSVKSLTSKDDYVRALIYPLHQKLGNKAGDLTNPNTEKLDKYAREQGGKISINSKILAHNIVEIPEEALLPVSNSSKDIAYEGVMTPSGVAISIAGMNKQSLVFWKGCNGALIKFTTTHGVKYEAVMSRRGETKLCGSNTKFWGYYKAGLVKTYQDLKNTKPQRYSLIRGGKLNERLFTTTHWFPVSNRLLGKGARLRLQHYKLPYLNSSQMDDSQLSGFWKLLTEMKILTKYCREDIYWDNIREKKSRIEGFVETNTFDTDSHRTIQLQSSCELSQLLTNAEKKGVNSGWGTLIYLKHYQTSGVDTQALIKFANLLTQLIGKEELLTLVNFSRKFTTTNAHHTAGRPALVIREMLRLGYKSKKELDEGKVYVALQNKVRSAFSAKKYTVWATYDPWKGSNVSKVPSIATGYNVHSRDYTVKQSKEKYHYSIQDLIARHIYVTKKRTFFTEAILAAEAKGNALAISGEDGANQYKAMFGSNAALYSWVMYAGACLTATVDQPLELLEKFGQEVARLIGKAEIPEWWWNPACTLAKRQPGEIACNKCGHAYATLSAVIFNDEVSRLSFAFLAGLYNGVIGQAKGVFQMIAMVSGYFSNPQTKAAVDGMIRQLREKGLGKLLSDMYQKETCNAYVTSYYIGKHLIDIASLVVGSSQVSALAKGAKNIKATLGKFKQLVSNKALGSIKGTEQAFERLLGYVEHTAAQATKLLLEAVETGGKKVYQVVVSSPSGKKIVATIEDGLVKARKSYRTTQVYLLKTEQQVNHWLDQVFGRQNRPPGASPSLIATTGQGQTIAIKNLSDDAIIYRPPPVASKGKVNFYGRYKSYGAPKQSIAEVDKILNSLRQRLKTVKKTAGKMKKAYQQFQHILSDVQSNKLSWADGKAQMEQLFNDFKQSKDVYQRQVVADMEEALNDLGAQTWPEMVSYVAKKNTKTGLQDDLIPHFDDIRLNLGLRGLPKKTISYRNRSGGVPLGKNGGTVAASEIVVNIDGKTLSHDSFIGASVQARTNASSGSTLHLAAKSAINRRYINVLKKDRTQTMLDYNNKMERFTNHAEQDNLGQIGDWLDNNRGKVSRKDIMGNVYMHVDKEVCNNCTTGFDKNNGFLGPLYLFSEEFPNIKVSITNSINSEIIVVFKGKLQRK